MDGVSCYFIFKKQPLYNVYVRMYWKYRNNFTYVRTSARLMDFYLYSFQSSLIQYESTRTYPQRNPHASFCLKAAILFHLYLTSIFSEKWQWNDNNMQHCYSSFVSWYIIPGGTIDENWLLVWMVFCFRYN